MGPESNAPPPGSLTVPLLHGWGVLLVLLGLVIVIAVCFFLVSASSPSDSRSAEWRSWLDARSRTGNLADGAHPANPPGPQGNRSSHGPAGTTIRR